MKLIFTLLSDLLKFGEKKLAVLGLLAFSGMLSIDSKYVPSEPHPAHYTAFSPLGKFVVLILYGIEALSILLMCFRWKTVARPLLRDPFLLGLMAMTFVSYLWSDFPSHTLRRGISTIQTAVFGIYLAARYSVKEQVKLVAWAMGIMSVFSFFYTLALPGFGRETGMHAPAWRGPFAHKNPFAQRMALAIIPLMLVAMDSRKHRFQLWTVFLIAVFLVLMTTSKTGLLIALNFIFLVPVFQMLRWRDNVMIPILITILLVAGSGATFLLAYWEPFLYGLGKDPTLSGRTYLWEAAIDKIVESPWLGYGYQAVWQTDGAAASYIRSEVNYEAAHAHNGFVNLSLDLGLVGSGLFILSIITTFIRGVSKVRVTTSYLELWPLLYMSYLLFYNQTESTIIAHNSLFFVLHIATSFSSGFVRNLKPAERRLKQQKDREKKIMNAIRPP